MANLPAWRWVCQNSFWYTSFLSHCHPSFPFFEVNYNSLTEKWDLHKLVAMCVQEEERLKQ
jgi:hypothetical protein